MSDDAAASSPASPGARLRRARESRGWTALQAADLMRLPPSVVEALERDRYAELGAPVFARGHLRRYATLLELAADPLLEAYDLSHAGPAPPSLIPQASANTPVRATGQRLRLPPMAWYALGLALLVAVVAGGWWWWTNRTPVAAEPAAVLPGESREEGVPAFADDPAAPGDATSAPNGSDSIAEAAPASGTPVESP